MSLKDFKTAMEVISWFGNCYLLCKFVKELKNYAFKKLGIGSQKVIVVSNVERGAQNFQMQNIKDEWFDALSDISPPSYSSEY